MNVAIELLSEGGFKLAGTDFANLVLYEKYTLPVQGGEYLILAGGSIAYWDAYAIVPEDGSVIRFYRADFHVVEQGGKARVAEEHIGKTIECYSFGPVIPADIRKGLELFTPDGIQTLNTARRFLRLKGVHADPRNYMLDFQVGSSSYPSMDTGFGSGRYAWSTGNSRYFYRRTQFSSGFTDEYEAVLAVRVNDLGIYSNQALQFGATKRTNGWGGYGNHVPQTGPISILVANVSGL